MPDSKDDNSKKSAAPKGAPEKSAPTEPATVAIQKTDKASKADGDAKSCQRTNRRDPQGKLRQPQQHRHPSPSRSLPPSRFQKPRSRHHHPGRLRPHHHRSALRLNHRSALRLNRSSAPRLNVWVSQRPHRRLSRCRLASSLPRRKKPSAAARAGTSRQQRPASPSSRQSASQSFVSSNSGSGESSPEAQVQTAISTYVDALQTGDLATLRTSTCGALGEYYRTIPDAAFAQVHDNAVAQKTIPQVGAVDAVRITDDTAIAQVQASLPSTGEQSWRTFDPRAPGRHVEGLRSQQVST